MANVISLAAHLQKRSAAEPIERILPPKGTQLALPFSTPHSLVLVFADHIYHRRSFEAFAEHTQPQAIIDLRIAPRLDFVANTRALALRKLELEGISYLDVRGRFEQKLISGSVWFSNLLSEVKILFSALEISHRSILLFFDDPELLRRFSLELNREYNVVVAEQRYIENVLADSDQLQM